MRKFTYILMIIIALSIGFGCSDQDDSGGDDTQALLEAAWNKFEIGDYQGAAIAFGDLINQNKVLAEAYNGSGWSYFYLDNLDRAIADFSKATQQDPAVDLQDDINAGLTFVYDAQNQPNNCIGASENVSSGWAFGHGGLDYGDIILVRAVNYYALGDFDNSLVQVRILDPTFTADVSTPEGRAALAEKIEELS